MDPPQCLAYLLQGDPGLLELRVEFEYKFVLFDCRRNVPQLAQRMAA